MAEWCEEIYTLHFPEESRRELPFDDPAYKASELLRGYLDLEESGYKEGAPLSIVMDVLGYKGDRSGLTEHSVVTDVWFGKDLSFVVKDNFSDFDVCRSLAKELGVDINVDVRYRFSEGPNIERESDEQHFVAKNPKSLTEDIRKDIEETLHYFSSNGKPVEFVSFYAFSQMAIDSVGPEPDRINLVRDGIHLDDRPDRVSVRLSEITDSLSLEILSGYIKSNFEDLARRSMLQSRVVSQGQESGSSSLDVEGWREMLLEQLYGSSAAYQNISEFMNGFDVQFIPGTSQSLSPETALEVAKHAQTYDGGETDLSGEVVAELEAGVSPEQALREWDIDYSNVREPDRLKLMYDGDPMMEFSISSSEPWSVRNVDLDLVDYFKEKTGVNLKREFGLEGDFVGVDGKKVLDICHLALVSPQNKEAIHDAERKCTRRLRQRSMLDSLNGNAANVRGKHI